MPSFGQTTSYWLFFLVASIICVPSTCLPQEQAQKKWFIGVGINRYNQAPNLEYCVNDSRAMANVFRSLGFQVVKLLNDEQPREFQPTRENIERVLAEVVRDAKPMDLIVFAFSGHGVGSSDGRSWICPLEANLRQPESTMISIDSLVNELLKCQAKQRVIFLDACRNSAAAGGRSAVAGEISEQDAAEWKKANQSFVPKISPPQNQELALFASCDDRQESFEVPDLEHGIFTWYLLQALQGKGVDQDGYVEVTRVFGMSRDDTSKLADQRFSKRQTPIQSGYFGSIRLGKFITLIDEDLSDVDLGGLPAGPWEGSPQIIVDRDVGGRKILCANGNGGWVYAQGIQVSGEYELTLNLCFMYKVNDNRMMLLAFDEEQTKESLGVKFAWNSNTKTLSTSIGPINKSGVDKFKDRHILHEETSKSFQLKVAENEQQVEVEVTIRRELVRRGRELGARYQIVVDKQIDDSIVVSRPDVLTFDQIGFYIESDGGQGHRTGVRKIRLQPVIGK